MAFFKTPDVEWLYSGGDEDEPVEPADGRCPALGVCVLVLPHARWKRLVQGGKGVVSEVTQLKLGVVAPTCLLHHPARDRLASAAGAGASEDDADASHECTCEPVPRSRRIDSRTTSVVLVVNT